MPKNRLASQFFRPHSCYIFPTVDNVARKGGKHFQKYTSLPHSPTSSDPTRVPAEIYDPKKNPSLQFFERPNFSLILLYRFETPRYKFGDEERGFSFLLGGFIAETLRHLPPFCFRSALGRNVLSTPPLGDEVRGFAFSLGGLIAEMLRHLPPFCFRSALGRHVLRNPPVSSLGEPPRLPLAIYLWCFTHQNKIGATRHAFPESGSPLRKNFSHFCPN